MNPEEYGLQLPSYSASMKSIPEILFWEKTLIQEFWNILFTMKIQNNLDAK